MSCFVLSGILLDGFVDTKGVIRSPKSKNKQRNCQKKKNKRANKDLPNTTQKPPR